MPPTDPKQRKRLFPENRAPVSGARFLLVAGSLFLVGLGLYVAMAVGLVVGNGLLVERLVDRMLSIFYLLIPVLLLIGAASAGWWGSRGNRVTLTLAFSSVGILVIATMSGMVVGIREVKHAPSSLGAALLRSDKDYVTLYLSRGADPDKRDRYGGNPLDYAVNSGRVDHVRLLLEHGADPDALDTDGGPVLFTPVMRRDHEMARVLLEAGADPNVREEGRDPLLSLAVTRRDMKLVQLLLDHGADPHLKQESGITPLELARQSGNEEMVRIIENALSESTGEVRHATE